MNNVLRYIINGVLKIIVGILIIIGAKMDGFWVPVIFYWAAFCTIDLISWLQYKK
jgi:hypothetical protein